MKPTEARIVYERREVRRRIEYDPKIFPPCVAKEVPVWSWRRMKHVKYIVHIDRDGTIKRERLE